MDKGIFITFEGVDGSGKSTVSKIICDSLKEEGYDVVYTREPGGVDISEKIRDIILDVNNQTMDAKTEALLYAASRRQHLVDKIIPAIKKGSIVICDRFVHSSLVYQGVARKIGVDEVMSINKFAIEGFMPTKTLFFDLDEKEGLKRISNRVNKDRLDLENTSFHKLVKQGYQVIKDQYKDNMIIIDASKSLEEVIKVTLDEVKKIIHENR